MIYLFLSLSIWFFSPSGSSGNIWAGRGRWQWDLWPGLQGETLWHIGGSGTRSMSRRNELAGAGILSSLELRLSPPELSYPLSASIYKDAFWDYTSSDNLMGRNTCRLWCLTVRPRLEFRSVRTIYHCMCLPDSPRFLSCCTDLKQKAEDCSC